MARSRLACLGLTLLASCQCAAGSEADCSYNGNHHAIGATFPAGDDCNQCVCTAAGEITCTEVVCRSEDGGLPEDAGRDGGARDTGPTANEVVPIPDAPCQITAVNGVPASAALAPGDVVAVTAAGYPAPTTGHSVSRVDWSLALAPTGSHALVDPQRGAETTLSSATGMLGADLAGTYVLRALVMDDASATARHDCWLEFAPTESLYIELVWDSNQTDFDLHGSKRDDQGRYCVGGVGPAVSGLASTCNDQAPLDCSHFNCRPGALAPDWDGDSAAHGAGDPEFAIDDQNGFGPEVIRVPQLTAGSYLVGVQYFFAGALTTPVSATVRVWMFGQLRGQATRPLTEKEWWEPFTLDWSAGGDVCIGEPAVDAPPLCAPAPQCEPAATCQQCRDDAACGPATHCASDRCQPDVVTCRGDEQCGAGLRCIPATDSCWQAECSPACANSHDACAPDTFSCFLAPAECTEADEPNNTAQTATPIVAGSYQGVLCRGDTDYLSYSASADIRLHAAVDVAAGMYSGTTVELLDPGGAVVDSRLIAEVSHVDLYAAVPSAGSYLLRLQVSLEAPANQYNVAVTVEELPSLSCLTEPGEPNDRLDQAAGSPLQNGAALTRTLCGEADVDCYAVTAPADQRTAVRVSFDPAEGETTLALVDASGAVVCESGQPGGNWREVAVRNGVATATLNARLTRGFVPGNAQSQSYTIASTSAPLPACADAFEPNETMAQAHAVGPGRYDSGICQGFDRDFFAVDLAAGAVIDATVVFAHGEGNLELDLVHGNGGLMQQVDGAGDSEHINAIVPETGPYFLRVAATPPSQPVDRQPYTLFISATPPDAGQVADH